MSRLVEKSDPPIFCASGWALRDSQFFLPNTEYIHSTGKRKLMPIGKIRFSNESILMAPLETLIKVGTKNKDHDLNDLKCYQNYTLFNSIMQPILR